MKVLIKTYEDDYDMIMHHKLFIDGEEKLTIGRCEPEDAIIGRDLVDAHDIVKFMNLAHEAGKKGEKIEVEIKEVDEEEFWG